MSLATTVATAIEKVNDLMDLVKGQYNKWDKEVKDKINWADTQIKNLIASSDNRYLRKGDGHYKTIFVGTPNLEKDSDAWTAEHDKFYPVVINNTEWYGGTEFIDIMRASTHTDWSGAGSLNARLEFHKSGCGNGSDFVRWIHLSQTKEEHIARLTFSGGSGQVGIVVWLRGQKTYHIKSSATQEGVNAHVVMDGSDIGGSCGTISGAPLDVKDDAVPANGYRLGA